MYHPYSANYHAKNDDGFAVTVRAYPGVASDSNNSYYTLLLGELTIFLADVQCVAILDALGSRPPLPQPDPECTCVRTGDVDDARDCEAHK